MANTKSAKKAVRVSARKRSVNNKNKTAFREARKDVYKAITDGKKSGAKKLLPEAYKKIDFAAKKGTIHRKTADRYKSRLAKAVDAAK